MPDKNLVALIEAFADAGFGAGEAELELCGTGPLDVELSALAERLGVPLRLHGYMRARRAAGALRARPTCSRW